MTLLYIVGTGTKHDNVELRWSLRSVAKFARGVTRIVVAGTPPEWLSDDVERFEYRQHLGRTNRNIPDTALAAIKVLGLTGDVVLAYDDCILTAETDFGRLPLLCRGWSLPKETSSDNGYFKALVETRRFLLDHELPCIDFEQHAFKVFSADAIMRRFGLVRKSIDESAYGVTADCLFVNLTLAEDPRRQIEFRQDLKLRKMTEADLSAGWCTSFSDAAFDDPAFVPLMNSHFGQPCRYERSDK